MNQFLPEELVQFLQKADDFLTKDCDLIVIGGAAAALAYGVTKATTDIDLATALPEHVKTAIDHTRKATGICHRCWPLSDFLSFAAPAHPCALKPAVNVVVPSG